MPKLDRYLFREFAQSFLATLIVLLVVSLGGVMADLLGNIADGKLPLCAEMCSTKALIAGDADVVANIFRERVLRRGTGAEVWGWDAAYGGGERKQERKREGQS